MRLNVFAVRDKAAEMFLAPFYVRAPGEASRTFTELLNDPKTPFYKSPADFDLFHLGYWDDGDGSFVQCAEGCTLVLTGIKAHTRDAL